MSKFVYAGYAIFSYVIFLLSFLYAIGFVGGFVVPKSINSGITTGTVTALIVNCLLLAAFAIQHSVMARPGFKNWFTRFVPTVIERSTYVLLSSVLLFVLYWFWIPMPTVIWRIEPGLLHTLILVIFWTGWLMVLVSTFLINHFDLFGLRQVYINYRGQEYHHLDFRIIGLYKLCRHPIMLGFVIAFWATPNMTVGHLLFAAATTAYIIIALQFEERDLVTFFGDVYRDYQEKVPMLFPIKFGK